MIGIVVIVISYAAVYTLTNAARVDSGAAVWWKLRASILLILEPMRRRLSFLTLAVGIGVFAISTLNLRMRRTRQRKHH